MAAYGCMAARSESGHGLRPRLNAGPCLLRTAPLQLQVFNGLRRYINARPYLLTALDLYPIYIGCTN